MEKLGLRIHLVEVPRELNTETHRDTEISLNADAIIIKLTILLSSC